MTQPINPFAEALAALLRLEKLHAENEDQREFVESDFYWLHRSAIRRALEACAGRDFVVLPREPTEAILKAYMSKMRLANVDNAKMHIRSFISAAEDSHD